MLRKKLIYRFVFQIMIAGLLLLGLAVFILIWMLNAYNNIQLERNFTPYGLSKLISEAEVDEHGFIINSELITQLEADGGWLQSLDENGNVLQSFFTPEDVPNTYIPAQLIDYWLGKKAFPYSLGLWIQMKDEQRYILLYGKRSAADETLSPIIETAQIKGKDIILPEKHASNMEEKNGWIQVFSRDGAEIAAWNRPADASSFYNLDELALRNKFLINKGIAIESEYDEDTELTWIVQYPLKDSARTFNIVPSLSPELQLIIVSGLLFLSSSFLVLVILAIWYANRFMKPIMEIVSHIKVLGDGDIIDNTNKKHNKHRKKLFADVFDSIESVAKKLQASKTAEKQTQAYREEWIAGVTHDMKTPLSSIEGYAHMLAATQYKWSEDDVRKFAQVMLEKSQYMDHLLDDLSLTYRLRSSNLPVPLTRQNIGLLLYEAVNKTALHPNLDNKKVKVQLPDDIDVYGHVYPPWFERIVNNLVVNALLHNPEHTQITITLSTITEKGWQIAFRDNGNGMDEKTLQQLFERYYRGTNTDAQTEGSGLGLAVTKELVQAMGGTIAIYSEQGKGTILTLNWKEK